MTVCAAYLEAQIVGPLGRGERYTVVDGYLYTVGSWLEGWRGHDAVSEADGVSGTRGSAGCGAAGGEGGAELMRTRIDRTTPT